jgi:nicotinamidase-related amidase
MKAFKLTITILATIMVLMFIGAVINVNKIMENKNTIENCLVVVDCQNDFIGGSLANKEAQMKVPNVVTRIHDFKKGVIFVTLDTHGDNYPQTKEGQYLPVIHCIKDSWGWELEETVKSALDDATLRGIEVVYVEKPTFGSSELVRQMKDRLSESDVNIDICGFCTDICVISNALLIKEAFYETANINVYENSCAGVTIESHNAALTTMKMCQINVIE